MRRSAAASQGNAEVGVRAMCVLGAWDLNCRFRIGTLNQNRSPTVWAQTALAPNTAQGAAPWAARSRRAGWQRAGAPRQT